MTGRRHWSISGRLLAAAATGASVQSIATAFGRTVATIEQMAQAEGIRLPVSGTEADAGLHLRLRAIYLNIPKVEVPRWVPADLADEFLRTAAESGEEAAASLVRQLKRDMVLGAAA